MSKPIIITKIKDCEGRLCWKCPFDKTLYLLVDNFIKHMAFLHNLNIPEFVEKQKGLLKCECGSYFISEYDLKVHQKVHGTDVSISAEEEAKARRVQCGLCLEVFESFEDAYEHAYKVHLNER